MICLFGAYRYTLTQISTTVYSHRDVSVNKQTDGISDNLLKAMISIHKYGIVYNWFAHIMFA